jgi:hypothetical protein
MADTPAMLLAAAGTVVEVIVLPAMSMGAEVSAKLDTVRSAEVWPAATVYVPDKVDPADALVSATVAPAALLSVTVMVEFARTLSLSVAVMLIVSPAL